jgi:hypothetical protein
MPFHCQYCGGNFCDEHRLPPNHNCAGIEIWKKKPVPGVGIRYGHGGGAVPTMGGYPPERTGRKPRTPWGPYGIPYLKIAIAIIVIIFLLLLYLGLTGYFPGAEKTPVNSRGIPEPVSTIPAPVKVPVPAPALTVPADRISPSPQSIQPTLLPTPVVPQETPTIPVTSATHVPATTPTRLPTTTRRPHFPL